MKLCWCNCAGGAIVLVHLCWCHGAGADCASYAAFAPRRCACRFKILGCHHKAVANVDAYWICPEEDGTAYPSDNVCVCDDDDIRTCGFHVGSVTESGIYAVKGFGGKEFSAYLDYDTEMTKVRALDRTRIASRRAPPFLPRATRPPAHSRLLHAHASEGVAQRALASARGPTSTLVPTTSASCGYHQKKTPVPPLTRAPTQCSTMHYARTAQIWMMVMGVNHAAKDSRVCSINTTMPLSKTAAYNSVRLVDFLPEITVNDVATTRFYCNTKCVLRAVVRWYACLPRWRAVSVASYSVDAAAVLPRRPARVWGVCFCRGWYVCGTSRYY